MVELSVHSLLKSNGYHLVSSFGYDGISTQAKFNKNLLESETFHNLENKVHFAIVPGELVPENYPMGMDLTNRYCIYEKKRPVVKLSESQVHPFGEWGKEPLTIENLGYVDPDFE